MNPYFAAVFIALLIFGLGYGIYLMAELPEDRIRNKALKKQLKAELENKKLAERVRQLEKIKKLQQEIDDWPETP